MTSSLFRRTLPARGLRRRRTTRPVLEQFEARLLLAALVEPPSIVSQAGSLRATLVESEVPTWIDGQVVTGAKTYNGTFAGVTLKALPGDLLDIDLVNDLTDPSNLHTHGLHVSPVGNGDNPFLQIGPGESNGYKIQVPADHPQGMYWYHPHEHGLVDDQIRAGLSGMLIIGRADGGAPELDDFKQVLMGLKGLTASTVAPLFTGLDSSARYAVNGQINPTMTMAPGEAQVWNVANLSLESNFRLQLDGHQLHVVALDGNPLTRAQTVDFIDLTPGNRASFLVQAGTAGTYAFRTLEFFNGFNSTAGKVLSTVEVSGTPVFASLPTTLTPPSNYFKDLSGAVPAAERSVLFQEDKAALVYSINGQSFPDVPSITARLNTVEEWTIINDTSELHPFHIHQNGFQLMSVNGTPVPVDGTPILIGSVAQYAEGFTPTSASGQAPQSEQYLGGSILDTVNVPARDPVTGEPGRVVVRMRFENYLGTIVFHCHIPFHEDNGMMGIVRIVPEAPTYAVSANAGALPRARVIDAATGRVVGDFLTYDRSYLGGVNVAMADVNGDGVFDVITARAVGLPQVKVIDGTKLDWVDPVTRAIRPGALLANFLAFSPGGGGGGGASVSGGYFNGDHLADVVVGSGADVRIIDAAMLNQVGRGQFIQPGAILGALQPFGPTARGGVNVAAGDINGDGRYDLIAGAGPGAAPRASVFSGTDLSLLDSVLAYGPGLRGGVNVATGNVKGSGYADVITGAGRGGRPLVKVFSGNSGGAGTSHGGHAASGTGTQMTAKWGLTEVGSFLAYAPRFRGGVRVASMLEPGVLAPYGSSRDGVVTTPATRNGLRPSHFKPAYMKTGTAMHG